MRKLLLAVFFLTSATSFAHKDKWDVNKSKWSPLMLAIYNNQTDLFLKLIAQNVDINYITPSDKEGGLQLTAISVAIRVDNEEAINALVKTNKMLQLDESLLLACCFKNPSTINLLIKYGANPNYTNKNHHSAGMIAASFGSSEVLEALIKNGADVNQVKENSGMTMLMFAASKGDSKKIRLLLNFGADKNIKNKDGFIALHFVDRYELYLKLNPMIEKKNAELEELRELLK